MIRPDIYCVGCQHSDGHSYTKCIGHYEGSKQCLSYHFGNINDRAFGKERKQLWNTYLRKPF